MMIKLARSQILSLIYHDLFDYPLELKELKKWKTGKFALTKINHKNHKIEESGGYFYLKGRKRIVNNRKIKEKSSLRKIEIAKNASSHLSKIPFIKMVGITGSLAMKNAGAGSDIDLMIVSSRNLLWITRLTSLILLDLAGTKRRRAGETNQKDRVCLNLWLSEDSLVWPKTKRNIYTAHEIAQIIPLVNKNGTYEKLLYLNRWVQDYWPSAVIINRGKTAKTGRMGAFEKLMYQILYFAEPLIYRVQYLFMKPKITFEVIDKDRALFHPVDWSEKIDEKLKEL